MDHCRSTKASTRRGGMHARMGAIFACLGLFAVTSEVSADVVPLATLEARAISDNPSLEAREARVRAAMARVSAIRSEMMPRLSLELGTTLSPGAIVRVPGQDLNDDGDFDDEGEFTYARGTAVAGDGGDPIAFLPTIVPSAQVRFEGVLYDFGRTAARVRGARADAAAQEADIEAAEEAIIRTVRAAYLQWLAAHLRRVEAEASLGLAEQRVRDLGTALAAGARSEADRDGAAIEAARIRLELARARSSEAASRRTLARITGEPIAEDATPDGALLGVHPPSTTTQSQAAIRALELRQEIVGASERAYRLRHAPILAVSVMAGFGAQLTGDGDRSTRIDVLASPTYQVNVGLSVPLWDPRTRSFMLDEAIAQAEALEAAVVDTQRSMDAAELEARTRIEETDAEIELAQSIVDATARAASGTEERFRVTGGSIEPVLTARERERRARDELMRSRLERTDAVLRLMPVRRTAD